MPGWGSGSWGSTPWGSGSGGSGGGGSGSSGAAPAGLSDVDNRRLFGRDIYYDVREGTAVDTHVTKSGDYMVIAGVEAMRQSLLRRMISDPDEWPTLENYGAGLRSFVKERRTPANLAEMEERCKSQALRDRRVKSASVVLELIDGGVKLLLSVVPKFGPARAQPILITITQTETGVI
jgi:hypothetical protein